MGDRVVAEREFFNQYYRRSAGTALDRFYDRSAGILDFRREIFARCAGARVLEVGCGPGGHGMAMAERGADVTGIDISETAVELATHYAQARPELKLRYSLGNAEATEFESHSFDLICGTGIVHHLDVDRFGRELARLLKPGGACVFYEPVASNPIAAVYRVLTPAAHTPDEHPVVPADVRTLQRYFSGVDLRFFHVVSGAVIPLLKLPGGERILRAVEWLEKPLLLLPGTRWLGAFTTMVLTSRQTTAARL